MGCFTVNSALPRTSTEDGHASLTLEGVPSAVEYCSTEFRRS